MRKFGLHLVVEDLGLARSSGGNEVLVEDIENVVADLGQLGLDLLAVLLDQSDLGRVALSLLLLLDRSDYSPRGTAGANDVLVGNGEEVALLDGQVAVLGSDDLHVLDHLWSNNLVHHCAVRSLGSRKTHPRSAQPARRAWPDRQHLRYP